MPHVKCGCTRSVRNCKYGGVMWQCQSCQASTARLEASLKKVEKRLNNVEASMSNVEERVKLVDARVEKAELVAEQAKKEAHSVKEDVTQAVYEEMRERDEKRLNILLHNVPEAGEATEEEARRWDEESFNNIVGAMGLKLQFKECATFSSRLGQKGKDRPLLIGLKKEDDKAMILSCSSKLARSNFKEISCTDELLISDVKRHKTSLAIIYMCLKMYCYKCTGCARY